MAKRAPVTVTKVTDMPLTDPSLHLDVQQRLSGDVLLRFSDSGHNIKWSQYYTCTTRLPEDDSLQISVRVHSDSTVTLVFLRKNIRASKVSEHKLTPRG